MHDRKGERGSQKMGRQENQESAPRAGHDPEGKTKGKKEEEELRIGLRKWGYQTRRKEIGEGRGSHTGNGRRGGR